MDRFGKVGAETSYLQSQTHSDNDSARKRRQTRTLKMVNYDKFCRHHCKMQESRGPWILANANCIGETCCIVLIWKRWIANSNTVTRQICEDLFLKAIKIICSVKQNLNSWDRNIKLDHLNKCISKLQQLAFGQRLELQDARSKIEGESGRMSTLSSKDEDHILSATRSTVFGRWNRSDSISGESMDRMYFDHLFGWLAFALTNRKEHVYVRMSCRVCFYVMIFRW